MNGKVKILNVEIDNISQKEFEEGCTGDVRVKNK